MTNSNAALQAISNSALLSATRELARRASTVEADLLLHLGEVDHRKLYRDYACPSMFSFCLRELGFSEDAAYRRIVVARAARRFPALIDSLRSGQMHLAGLRLLVPHLTLENVGDLLAQSARKSKRAIEHLIARLFPKPAVPATFRKLPKRMSVSEAPQPGLTLSIAAPEPKLSPLCYPSRTQISRPRFQRPDRLSHWRPRRCARAGITQ
jgi:hypothetical protein